MADPRLYPPKHGTQLIHTSCWSEGILASSHLAKLWDAATGNELGMLVGHDNAVSRVAFSPDGKTLATASFDATIRLWDLPGGQPRAVLKGHTGVVIGVAFSPDGKLLASAGRYDKLLKLWELPAGKEVTSLTGHKDDIFAVDFAADGTTVATASIDGTVKLWDARAKRERASLAHEMPVTAVAIARDGRTLASGDLNGSVHIWDLALGRKLLSRRGHIHGVGSVAFSPDDRTLISGSGDRSFRVWDAASGEIKAVVRGHSGDVSCIAVSPNSKEVAVASWMGPMHVWELADWENRHAPAFALRPAGPIAFAPDGKTLAAVNMIHAGFAGYGKRVERVAFSPDGKLLANSSRDGMLELRDPSALHVRKPAGQPPRAVHSLAFSSDGKLLATASATDIPEAGIWWLFGPAIGPVPGTSRDSLRFWDVASLKEVPLLPEERTVGIHSVLAFAPDQRTLATGNSFGTVWLWDLVNRKRRAALFAGKEAELLEPASFLSFGWNRSKLPTLNLKRSGSVRALAFSPPNGALMAVACADGIVTLYDTASGQKRATLSETENGNSW